MIYCIEPEKYPAKENILEELIYQDENEYEWRIARLSEGFVVKYFGIDYFKEKTFECEISNGKTISVKNTNCILFKDESFDAFFEMRNILKSGYTDEIWEVIEELFTERFEHDETLLESEIAL